MSYSKLIPSWLGKSIRRARGSASISEFVMSIWVLLVLGFFPLLNLVGLAFAAGTLCLLTDQIATRCSEQLSYSSALTAMVNECTRLTNSGFGHYLRLTPAAGFRRCGSDLYVVATPIGGGKPQYYGPDTPMTNPPDQNHIYEFMASTSFIISPFISMSGIPLVNQVPALGKPVEIKFTAGRAVENSQAIYNASTMAGGNNLTVPDLTAAAGPDPPPTMISQGQGPEGWRNPSPYTAFPAGLTVVSETVFLVTANSMTWVSSQLNVAAGQSVWIDTHADGIWSFCPGCHIADADGGPPGNNWRAFGDDPTQAQPMFVDLIGYVGNAPPPLTSVLNTLVPVPQIAVPFPGYILLGDNSLTQNPGVGLFQAVCNDRLRQDNMGQQAVRVIVLQ